MDYKSIENQLHQQYKKMVLSKKELAECLGLGVSTVSKLKSQGYGLPNYKKLGNSRNARVVFPISEVARFLADTMEVA